LIRGVSSNDFDELEKIMKRGANEKQPFERLEMTKEELLKMFGVRFLFLVLI
jgi:threonyl-tRNA synthetase